MRVRWHCRGCDERGEQEISLHALLEIRQKLLDKDEEANLLGLILHEIKHDCKDTHIGILPC